MGKNKREKEKEGVEGCNEAGMNTSDGRGGRSETREGGERDKGGGESGREGDRKLRYV
jgi:hypothetical protein